ncbi:UNVERIFIED_CONTAM: hypothetical protein GTU68_047934, partial [Idotea baltica]|nr:hypothetical protein [Idotea baltica]
SKQIDEYTTTYEPEDQLEWSLVLGEIKSFIDADNGVNVLDMDSNTIVLSHRLSSHNTPPLEKSSNMNLSLQEILIVGNCTDQVKFSELTIDMFRMLQTLEREPQEDTTVIYDTSPAPGKMPFNGETTGRTSKRENPHKYLLYKPTLSQLMVFLASGFKELPANGAMLLYLSADGAFTSAKHPQDPGFDYGGVVTNSKRDSDHGTNKRVTHLKDIHCFYPGDLYSFTRKPLFIVVDSDNSCVFANMPHYFGQPLVVLMSPQETPTQFHDQHHRGNLFTLFLHCPLMGMCLVSSICDVPMTLWEKGQTFVEQFISEASKQLTRARNLGQSFWDPAYLQFFSDDFLRLLTLRFVFCSTVLRAHRAFKVSQESQVL